MAPRSADEWRQKIQRATLLTAVAFATACGGGDLVVATPDAQTRAARPNILFLLADDMRADAVGYAGNPIIRTPNLDALAHRGVWFSNAYVSSPICAISRASIFSGQYARRHGIVDFDHDFSPAALAQTYPALLHAAGYRTGFIGKFGVGNDPPVELFDYWRGFTGQGTYETNARDSLGHPLHLTKLMTWQAIEFLESQPHDRPFALSISYKAPHVQDEDPRQFVAEAADAGMYATELIPTPPTADDRYWLAFPQFFREHNLARERWQMLFSTPDKYQASVKGYYRLVSGLDRSVGALRAALRRLNLEDNTIIIFTSDNGFFLGELGMAHKWYGHDPSIRVPLIFFDPRGLADQDGREDTSIVVNEDIAPTLLELAGVRIPATMQGRSMVAAAHGDVSFERTDFLFEEMMPEPGIKRSTGVAGGRYKYLVYVDPQPNYEVLYDLVADPHETTNLAADPRYASILSTLRQRHADLVAQAR